MKTILVRSLLLLALAGATDAVAAARAWRPFSDDSPWNQPIPADARADRNSVAMIADFAARGALHVNIESWSIPVYYIDAATTPQYDVRDARPGIYGAGFGFPRAIPIPDGAVASPPFVENSDNHLCIVDRARGESWDMWLARRDAAGHWSTGLGAVVDLRGTGVAPPWFDAERQLDSHRSRAGGFPLIAGLIRPEEIAAGRIGHALAFAYDHCRTEFFVPPASTAQATIEDAVNWRGIPMGGRIQLDPGWDVEHAGLSPEGKIIARALQEYGAYCSDYAGGNVIYADNSPAALRAWRGVLTTGMLERVFTKEMIRAHFRVIDMGNFLPGQNLKVRPPYVIAFTAQGEGRPAEIDQLKRSVVVNRPGASREETVAVRWTTYPRETRASIAGHAAAPDAEIAATGSTELTLTAPDGTSAVWTVTIKAK
ncbi:MAG TPA: hypothetical protein VHE13_16445 [Opitutus sp.]|nr:hypothetical protein [Opitutus sp.]